MASLQADLEAVISHDSALALCNLSDLLSDQLHVTIPRTTSRRRPKRRLNTNQLEREDETWYEGLPVTTLARTLVDVATAGLADEQVRPGIHEALRRGLINRESVMSSERLPMEVVSNASLRRPCSAESSDGLREERERERAELEAELSAVQRRLAQTEIKALLNVVEDFCYHARVVDSPNTLRHNQLTIGGHDCTVGIDFEWDPNKAARNLQKHGVSFEEAVTIFRDDFSISIPDPDHSLEEERLITVGVSSMYGPEKSVADAFKFRRKLGLDLAIEALQACRRRPDFDMDRLLNYQIILLG